MADLRKRLSELTKELAVEVPVGTTIFLDVLTTLTSRMRREIPALGRNPTVSINLRKSVIDLQNFEDHHRQYRKLLSDLTAMFMNLSDAKVKELEKKWTPELDRQIAQLRAGRAKLTLGSREDWLALLSFMEKRNGFIKSINQETEKSVKFIGEMIAILKP